MQAALLGLGVMGANLALRISDTCADLLGGPLAVFDSDEAKRRAFESTLAGQSIPPARIRVCESMTDTIVGARAGSRTSGRTARRLIFLMVPAGAVDDALAEVAPLLSADDAVIECGNSHFRDTERRSQELGRTRLFGLGVSGGSAGARHGPSLMLGGVTDVDVQTLLARIAAVHNSEQCYVRCGEGGAGHYVKMVHNAIEYALMQGIAECFNRLLQGMDESKAADLCESWSGTPELGSYLMEITARTLRLKDQKSGLPLLRFVATGVGQKGTGVWALDAGIEAGLPTPLLSAAIMARLAKGTAHSESRSNPAGRGLQRAWSAKELEMARLALSFVWRQSFSEGLRFLSAGSHFGYEINQAEVLRAWRGGCIIRSLYIDQLLADKLNTETHIQAELLHSAREVLRAAVEEGTPMPVLAAAIQGYDMSAGRLPGPGIVSLQREIFGQHGYSRVDRPGVQHIPNEYA